MLINAGNLALITQGFNAAFNKGREGAESHFRDIAMVVPSQTGEEKYGWLGQFPKLRRFVGDRVIRQLAAHDYSVVNETHELTIEVKRTDIEDDRVGIYAPLATEIGRSTEEYPDEVLFDLLASGFTTLGYDGKPFFATDHEVGDPASGPVEQVSNLQAGAGPAWFLLETSRAIRPLLWQERLPFVFQTLNADTDEPVFWRDSYIYGVRGRAAAGFGLWQLAFASQEVLSAANYEAARVAMASVQGDERRPLGIRPNVLVVPPALEGDAMRLLNNGQRVEIIDPGTGDQVVAVQNEWAGTAKVIVADWLSA